jgi:hypothetical protein
MRGVVSSPLGPVAGVSLCYRSLRWHTRTQSTIGSTIADAIEPVVVEVANESGLGECDRVKGLDDLH